MNTQLIDDLRELARTPGVSVADDAERVQLRIVRSHLSVSIEIPREVLEVFIVVHNAHGDKIEDWLDYVGYEATPLPQVAEDMRRDVLQFANRLLSRELRVANSGKTLEWRVGERWAQAVPFVPDVQPR